MKAEDEKRLKELRKIMELNKTGFAGMLSNGNIVDRREHPEAIPIQENPMFEVVKPKDTITDYDLKKIDEAREERKFTDS